MGETPKPLSVGVVMWDGVELLDWSGPYEVLSTATPLDLPSNRYYFDPVTVARHSMVSCFGGAEVKVGRTFGAVGQLDIVIIPGGPAVVPTDPKKREPVPAWEQDVIEFIREQAPGAKVVASVCVGAFLFARTGLLSGLKATTHTALLDVFRQASTTYGWNIDVVPGKVVDNGKMISASGVSSGIDLGLYLLDRLIGETAMKDEASYLDGPWPLPGDTVAR